MKRQELDSIWEKFMLIYVISNKRNQIFAPNYPLCCRLILKILNATPSKIPSKAIWLRNFVIEKKKKKTYDSRFIEFKA